MCAYPVVCFLFSTKGSLMWHKRDNNIGNKIFTVINRACFLLITHHVCLAARAQSFFARFKLVAAIFLQDFLTCISPTFHVCVHLYVYLSVRSCLFMYFRIFSGTVPLSLALACFNYDWRMRGAYLWNS